MMNYRICTFCARWQKYYTHIQDLSSFVAKSVREVEHVMTVGAENRKVG